MYQINELASLFGMTSQALRYYQEIGLLTPEYVNPQNGYRYYTDASLDRLSQIIQLRSLGFGVNQIKNYFDNNYSKEEKINDLEKIIEISKLQILNIKQTQTIQTEFQLQIKQLSSLHVITQEKEVVNAMDVMALYGALMRYAIKLHVKLHEPIYFYLTTKLHDPDPGHFYAKAQLELASPIDGITQTLPTQKVASVQYNGLHSNLSTAYTFLYKTIEEQKLTPIGLPREKYIGPYNLVSDYCIIELQLPIA